MKILLNFKGNIVHFHHSKYEAKVNYSFKFLGMKINNISGKKKRNQVRARMSTNPQT